jgi:Raf kinase inhibitor-like YbhB/YbcL family protein
MIASTSEMARRRSSISRIDDRRSLLGALGSAASLAAALVGCRSAAVPSAAPGVTVESLTVTSRSFGAGAAIPIDRTCDGADRSPDLTWSEPPAATRAFAILVDDPDAPSGDFTHWVAFNLPADARSVPEGVDLSGARGVAGSNDFGRVGYSGPCPPRGELHRYRFRVIALDARVDAPPGASRDAVSRAMNGHVVAEGILSGTYAR